MKELIKSRGFWMSLIGTICITVGYALTKETTVATLVGVLWSAKIGGDQLKKAIRTSKGITYDQDLGREVEVENYKETLNRR